MSDRGDDSDDEPPALCIGHPGCSKVRDRCLLCMYDLLEVHHWKGQQDVAAAKS